MVRVFKTKPEESQTKAIIPIPIKERKEDLERLAKETKEILQPVIEAFKRENPEIAYSIEDVLSTLRADNLEGKYSDDLSSLNTKDNRVRITIRNEPESTQIVINYKEKELFCSIEGNRIVYSYR